ncbi:retrovirus-related pol polyprotein from transposon TNT 1-94 [Tanacetum coccineum]|uniref:Retrovirus-related pol polyprotein from transposon TNT 1-94 n=1 Tax=Tanacetum coccineum TaxID=301880 RepID=A0ABQ5ALI9_9ASTR
MTVDDLLQLVPQLMTRVDSLEKDLKQTKLTMGSAIVKLVMKVKKLEGILKRRNVILSDFKEEEPEDQGRNSQDDPLGRNKVEDISPTTLEAAKTLSRVASQKPKSIDKGRRYKRRKETKGKKVVTSLDFQEEVSTGYAEGVNTGSIKVSTVSGQVSTDSINKSIPSPDKGQREGKAPMIIEEAPKKTKEQILQEEASLAEAIRLDTLEKEEEAKQVHLDSLLAQRLAEEEELNEQQKQRRSQVQFEAQHYTDEDWDLIRAKIEANAELSKSVLGSGLQGEDFAKKMVELGTWKLSQLKNLSFEEVKEEFDKLVKQVESFTPINFEAKKDSLKRFGEELQTKTLKRLKSDEAKDVESIKKTRKRRKQIARKGLHSNKTDEDESEASKDIDPISGVYQIVRKNGTDIVYINFGAMLNDISRDDLTELYRIVMNRYGMNGPEDELEKVCKAMLDKKLQRGKPDEDCYKLLKMMEKQAGIRKHKDWLVQEQTTLGKDFSNPFMADNLPKIIWLSTHHIWYQDSPTKKHLEALKRVFRYLKGTINWGLSYPKDTDMALTAYANADHAGCQDTRRNIMADLNFPANDAPMEQAPTIASPTRTDDHILPLSKWVPIGKSNCVLDVHKPQRNPIFPIVVALLKNTNFFRDFTASSTILAIYIQQFWDTMCFNTSTGLYTCQFDEQWFNMHKDILRDALDIGLTNDNNPFVAPPSSDTVIEYVNTLGYPSTLRNVSAMSVNALYQPWRAVLSMINMCLTGKTAGYDRPRHPVLQILWGIIHRSNIDYAERIWEEFVQSIQTFLTDRKNLATAARGKKKTAHLLIPSVRFTKLIIHHLRTKHNIHPRTGSPLHYSHEESILNTLRFVGKDERGKAEERGATESSDATKVTKPKAAKVTKPAGDKAPKPTATQPPKPKPAPTQPSKAASNKTKKKKCPLKLVDEPSDEGVPVEDPAHTDEEADLQRALELSLKEQAEQTQGPARPVVLREPDSGKYQPLPEVQGKGKEKFVDEQAAYDLLKTPKNKSPTEQFIFQRRPPIPTESSAHAESPSIDAELNLTNSETESDEEASKINARNQEEGQAGPNPGA